MLHTPIQGCSRVRHMLTSFFLRADVKCHEAGGLGLAQRQVLPDGTLKGRIAAFPVAIDDDKHRPLLALQDSHCDAVDCEAQPLKADLRSR